MSAYERDRLSRFYRERVLPYLQVEHVFVGLKFAGRRGREWRAACPLHNGRNANFAVNTETLMWRCHSSCQCGGDAIKFVMMVEGLSFRDAVVELSRRAGIDASEIEYRPTKARARESKPAQEAKPKPVRRSVSSETSSSEYPAIDEVQSLWSVCRPVTDAPATVAWLVSRRMDPIGVADMDTARTLPVKGVALPEWAAIGERSWRVSGHHLITPAYDAAGLMRSIIARNVIGRKPKSVPPRGHRRAGLVLACPFARQLLEHGVRPAWWPRDVPLRVEVVEGEKKLAQRLLSRSDADACAPAVIGVTSGAWSAEIAARIPDGTEVYVATDSNPAGARYAAEVLESLASRAESGGVRIELRSEFRLGVDKQGRLEVSLTEVAA